MYVDPDGHQGVREWFKSAVNIAGEFAGGVIRGASASLSMGYAPRSAPRSDDSLTSRFGQVVGTGIVIGVGTTAAAAGGTVAVVTAPTVIGAVAGGTVAVAGVSAVAGGLVNAAEVVTTPIIHKSGTPKADSPVTTAERTPDGVTKGKTITDKQAVQRLRRGQDIDTSSKQKAKQLQKKASGGAVHDKPHFHGKERQGGHAFHDQ